tara:strand:+ start:2741 stop:4993 length:2253 start_codon:yes stop_codon:yes gene_type:complete
MRLFLALVGFLFLSTVFSEEWNCTSSSFSTINDDITDLSCLSTVGKTFSYNQSIHNEEKISEFLFGLGPDIRVTLKGRLGTYMEGVTLGGLRILAKVNYHNGDTYEGELKGGLLNGKGTFFNKEEAYIYQGDFIDSWETGQGRKTSLDSAIIIEGEFLEGIPHGFVVVTNNKFGPNNDQLYRYEGQAFEGKSHGLGKETISSSSKIIGIGVEVREDENGFYIGRILENSPASNSKKISIYDSIISISDRGKTELFVQKLNLEEVVNLLRGKEGNSVRLTLKDSSSGETKEVKLKRKEMYVKSHYVYEGMFIEDEKEGFGKAVYENGSIYEGTWRKNNWHGFGKRTWGQGQVFYGSYKDGNCEGTGIQLNAEYEIVYYGGFLDCLAHGYGGSIFETEDGGKIIKSGNFENNMLNGYGEATYPDGATYKGYWVDDEWRGQGEAYFPEFKETHIGVWETSFYRLDGEGSLLTPSFQYFGEFKDNVPHGIGRIRYRETNKKQWGEERRVRYEENKLAEFLPPIIESQEKRVAMIIGNSAYMSSRLEGSLDDSYGMAATLEELGFRVMHKTNLKQKSFREAIWEFSEYVASLGPNATALFYYAGHAVQLENQNFLIPIDSRMEDQKEIELEAINAEIILNALNKASKGTKILILDACRNNPFKSLTRSSSGGLAQMSAPVGTFIAYSTAPGALAVDITSDGYSIYTGNLINNIKIQGITIEEVFKRTRADVVRQSQNKQVPWDSSSLIGDFYFNK